MFLAARSLRLAALLALVTSATTGRAAEMAWQGNLSAALSTAAQSNRLVLIHCWAPWCGPCMRMEREVFTQAGLNEALASNFVLVKFNADDHQPELQQYGVRSLPSDVIMSPDGRVLKVMQSPHTADQYAGVITQVATAYRAQQAAALAAAAPQTAPVQPQYSQQQIVPPAQPVAPQAPQAPPTASIGVQPPAEAMSQPVAPPTATAARLALDGYCPVQLMENRVWAAGDPQHSATYQGQLFYFASAEAIEMFWRNPDHYAPAAVGNDAVIALDEGQQVPGQRRHGVYYGDRIYLFANEQTLAQFYSDPERYSAAARGMQAAMARDNEQRR